MKKQSMDGLEPCTAAESGAVTVKSLRALLDAAEASGYGDAPLEVKGCRFAEMHLRVETLLGHAGGADGHTAGHMKTEKPSVSYGTEGCGDGSGFDTAALVG